MEDNKNLEKIEALIKAGESLLNEGKQDEAQKSFDEAQELAAAFKKSKDLESSRDSLKSMHQELSRSTRTPTPSFEADKSSNKEECYEKAFGSYLRCKSDMRTKALAENNNADGGVLVPEQMLQRIIQRRRSIEKIEPRATLINVEREVLKIPTFDAAKNINSLNENASISEIDLAGSFGEQEFRLHKYAVLVKVSDELLEDSVFDLEGFLAQYVAKEFAEELEDRYLNGDGIRDPQGLLNVTLGNTAITASALTGSAGYDKLVDCYMGLPEQYRNGGAWFVSGDTLQKVMKLKNSDGVPYIQQLANGEPPLLLGKPLIEINAMNAASSAGDAFALFGDMSFYYIAQKGSMRVKRLNELYAGNGQVGYRFEMRMDAHLLDRKSFIRLDKS